MNKIIFLLLVSSFCFSQKKFVQGTIKFVDNTEKSCYILQTNMFSVEKTIQIQDTENSDRVQMIEIEKIKYILFDSGQKFVQTLFKFDTSNDKYEFITYQKEPVYENINGFLEVIVESSNIKLLTHQKYGIHRFYLLVNNVLTPLVYKKYFLADTENLGVKTIKKNNDYVRTLHKYFVCDGFKINVNNLYYNKNSLKKLTEEYLKCINEDVVFEKSKESIKYDFRVFAGASVSYLNSRHKTRSGVGDYDKFSYSTFNYKLGVSNEFILPYNNDKISLLFEVMYNKINYNKNELFRFSLYSIKPIVELDYIEASIGLRYYIYKKANKSFNMEFLLSPISYNFNGNYTTELYNSNNIQFSSSSYDIWRQIRFTFGSGYYFDKFGLQLRYSLEQNQILSYSADYLGMSELSLLLSYRLF